MTKDRSIVGAQSENTLTGTYTIQLLNILKILRKGLQICAEKFV